jgi:hypothetical protein
MGRRKVVDIEAKLFEERKRGCLTLLAGPPKVGEIEYERFEEGDAKLIVRLKRMPAGAGPGPAVVLVADVVVAELDVTGGPASLRLDTRAGATLPDPSVGDHAAIRVGDTVVCSGAFRPD